MQTSRILHRYTADRSGCRPTDAISVMATTCSHDILPRTAHYRQAAVPLQHNEGRPMCAYSNTTVRAPLRKIRPSSVQLHRARQHARFGVAALRGHHVRLVDMCGRLHRLRDDRAFVEIAGHIVRRRADQLHAAIERLRVGLRALEARQEGVVDVDAACPASFALRSVDRICM